MAKIEIDPTSLLGAARGLTESVEPAMREAAQKMATSHLVDPPGWGIALAPLEAYFNTVGDYQTKNLQAAATAVDQIAQGLRKTVDNYNAAEKANVEMMQGTHHDSEGYLGGLQDTGIAREFYTAPDGAGEIVSMVVQTAAVGLGVATGLMAPDYLAAPIAAELLVANAISIYGRSRELNALALSLDTDLIPRFDRYANSATSGWKDTSVDGYIDVILDMDRELKQLSKAISTMSSVLLTVEVALCSFWVAFAAFSVPFFLTITELTALAIGPQVVVVEAIIQSLGAIAGLSWLNAAGTVIALIGTSVGLISGIIKDFGGLQKFDEQGDNTPDIEQINIAWHSA